MGEVKKERVENSLQEKIKWNSLIKSTLGPMP